MHHCCKNLVSVFIMSLYFHKIIFQVEICHAFLLYTSTTFYFHMQKHRNISSKWNSSVSAAHSVHLFCMKRNTQVKRALLTSRSYPFPLSIIWSIMTAHRLRERGNSVSSDCAHVQYTLEELLLLGNASLASSSVCHTYIPMVGDSCFMPPPQLSWYKCRQVCRWKITQKTLYPAQHFVLDQWQDNHRLSNRAPGGHLQGVYNCDSH